MLNLENIGIEFSGRWLLKNANYQFLPGERIGLIGRNGAGKSSRPVDLAFGRTDIARDHPEQGG
ncbi:MAG: hypothetical protein AAFP02_05075, partial [Bacteroidota bacterium]